MPLLTYINYRNWLRYYCLQSKQSVIEFTLSSQDFFIINLKSGLEVKAMLTDKFLIHNYLMLRVKVMDRGVKYKTYRSGFSLLSMSRPNPLQALKTFFFSSYQQIYLSEETLGSTRFRQLLCRLNSIQAM